MLRLRRGEPSSPSRTEAFSDGVFAVAITLLALNLEEIHADAPHATLLENLATQWPTLLAFVASFAFIGVAWANHRSVFDRIARQSRALVGANLLVLLAITLVPWATSTLAGALSEPAGDGGTQEIILYGVVTGFGAVTWGVFFHVLSVSPDLLKDPTHAEHFRADRTFSLVGITVTAIAVLVGVTWNALVAVGLFAALPIVFFAASDGFERTKREARS